MPSRYSNWNSSQDLTNALEELDLYKKRLNNTLAELQQLKEEIESLKLQISRPAHIYELDEA